MTALAEKTKWTYRRMLKELPAESRYQLLHNQLFMSPSPFYEHQKISHTLDKLLSSFVEQNNLGEVLVAPMDVIFDENNVVQPDIIFVSTENQSIIDKHIHGAPDLLVEIVSKSSVYHDYIVKKGLYEKFGVKEYWIVDPSNETVVILTLENGTYTSKTAESSQNEVESSLLKNFRMQVSTIFPGKGKAKN